MMEATAASGLDKAVENIGALSACIEKVVSSADTALAYVFSLLLDDDVKSELFSYQISVLQETYSAKFAEMVESTCHVARKVPVEFVLLSLERCVVSLRGLSKLDYDKFMNTCRTLVLADDEMTLLEYSVTAFVRRRLDHHFGFVEQHPAFRSDLRDSLPEAALLLSIMAWAGADSESAAARAFTAGLAELPANLADGIALRSLKPFDPDEVNHAVSLLSALKVEGKEALFHACLAAVGADDEINRTEYEILRLFALMTDCPLPAGFGG
jgi:hypothetical protein